MPHWCRLSLIYLRIPTNCKCLILDGFNGQRRCFGRKTRHSFIAVGGRCGILRYGRVEDDPLGTGETKSVSRFPSDVAF